MSTVLEDADRLTTHDRANDYGDAGSMAERFARLARAATGLRVEPEHLPILMVCHKLARARPNNGPVVYKREGWVDIAGYARVAEMVEGAHDDAPPVESGVKRSLEGAPLPWCPICEDNHHNPGAKTNAGVVTQRCGNLPKNDPRNRLIFEGS